MTSVPPNPAQMPTTPFAPSDRRPLTVFGSAVEAVLLLQRATRPDQPGAERPAFRPPVVPRILAAETAWQDDVVAVTGNRYPFAQQAQIFWAKSPGREHTAAFLERVFAAADRIGGTALVNSIGAAASIPHAHAHVTPERQPLLGAVRTRPAVGPWVPHVDGVRVVAAELPFCLIGLLGEASRRAAAVHALQVCRMTAAANLIAQDGATWIYPRSVETPAPHFPHALGAAEIWGRFCFVEPDSFARATGPALEQALILAGCAPM